MNTKDSLFALIATLSNNEKRYITLSMQGEQKDCIKLFKALKKQKTYNEKPLLAALGNPPLKKFRAVKQYLYKVILKNMRAYNAEVSVEMQLKSSLMDVQFLFKKGLYLQCEKLILKAKELANKYEQHAILLELLNWEKRLMKNNSYSGKDEKYLEELFQQILDRISTFKIVNEYDLIASRLFMKLKKEGNPRIIPPLTENHKIIHQQLLTTEETDLPYQARMHLYSYYIAYFNKEEKNLLKAYHYANEQVKLMELHPHLIEEEEGMRSYLFSSFNLLLHLFRLKKYDELLLTIRKFKSYNAKSDLLRADLFYITNVMELTMYIDQGEFGKAVQLVQKIEPKLLNKQIVIRNKEKEMILYYEFCNAYFGAGKYSKANAYLNKILNEPVDIGNDIQCFSRILNIIIHFELGHETLVEYLVKSTYQFLYKRKRLYKFETIVLLFIREKLPKIHSQKELLFAFKKLKEELEEVVKDPFEKRALDYFDFISWVESKIENRPFAEVLRRKQISVN